MKNKFKNYFFIVIFLLFFSITNVYGETDKQVVTLNKCVDGDTAYFMIDKVKTKVRFLAIDTPESANKIEEYGREASEFTCNLLTKANKIELEYDKDKTDKYNRTLAWIFVDDKLLQQLIVKEGLAEVAYLYDDYKYTNILKTSESTAKNNKLNIWNDYKEEKSDMLLVVLAILFIIILYIFSNKFRKKTNRKIKNKIKKEFNNIIK